jgi:hypothetical protein
MGSSANMDIGKITGWPALRNLCSRNRVISGEYIDA